MDNYTLLQRITLLSPQHIRTKGDFAANDFSTSSKAEVRGDSNIDFKINQVDFKNIIESRFYIFYGVF